MNILVLGMALIVTGALSIQFRDLCFSLKTSDEAQWKRLGSPEGFSFIDLGKTIGMYSWILNYGFEKSTSDVVIQKGRLAYKKALFVKYTLGYGCLFLAFGFLLAIFGV